jgi:protein TonB
MQRLARALRYPSSLALALGINLLLLLFVIRLVTGERERMKSTPDDVTVVDFVRLIRNIEPLQRKQHGELPELVQTAQPPPPTEKPKQIEPPPAPQMKVLTPDLAPPLNLTNAPTLPAFTPPKEAPVTPPSAPVAVQQTAAPPVQGAPAASEAAPSNEPVAVTAMMAISTAKPVYPQRALRAGLQGAVTLEFTVTPEGDVRDPKVTKANPPDVFDDAAKEAVLKWKFRPKMVDGRPVAWPATLNITFTLKKG